MRCCIGGVSIIFAALSDVVVGLAQPERVIHMALMTLMQRIFLIVILMR